jgi:hypothetical protein
MNNLQHTELNSYIREHVRALGEVREATSMCLGVALGRRLAVIPGEPTETLQTYTNQYTYQVGALAAQFNEQTLVDIARVDKIARGIWFTRQTTAYPPMQVVPPRGPGTFFEKIGNVPLTIDPKDMAYFNTHSEVLLTVINRISMILDTMMAQQPQG